MMELPNKPQLYKIKPGFAKIKKIPMYFIGIPIQQTEKAVRLYGRGTTETTKIGACMLCGRKLTHPVSVELGIGPECGGHYHNWNAIGGYTKANLERLKKAVREIELTEWIPKSCIQEHTDTNEFIEVPKEKQYQKKETSVKRKIEKEISLQEDGRIKVVFPINDGGYTLTLVKAISGRRYNNTNKNDLHWTVPYSAETVELFKEWGFKIGKGLQVNKTNNQVVLQINEKITLTGIDENIRSIIRNKMTFNNPDYENAVKHGTGLTREPELLKFYTEAPNGMVFLRGFFEQIKAILNDFDVHYKLIDKRHMGDPEDLNFKSTLRDYQKNAVFGILKTDFGVIESATGSGKTVIGIYTIGKRKAKTLILVHTKELLYQWKERIEQFLGIEPGLIGDGLFERNEPVCIAMVQTARKNIDKLTDFGYLIIDECHRTPSSTFREVASKINCKYMLGLSATAYRRDGLTNLIYRVLGDRVHTVDSVELRDQGAVLRPETRIRFTDFYMEYKYGDPYSTLLAALCKNEPRNNTIATDIINNMGEGVTLVGSDRVQHLKTLANMVIKGSRGGITENQIAILSSKTTMETRKLIVEKVNAGKIRILFTTYQLIGEGFDCEGLTLLFLTSPFKFPGRLIQLAGRILRPKAGKKPIIFDYFDVQVPTLARQCDERASTYKKLKQ